MPVARELNTRPMNGACALDASPLFFLSLFL